MLYADFRVSIQFIMVTSPCISMCTGLRLVAEAYVLCYTSSCSPDSYVFIKETTIVGIQYLARVCGSILICYHYFLNYTPTFKPFKFQHNAMLSHSDHTKSYSEDSVSEFL